MVNDVLTARVEAYTYNSMLPVILMDSHNRESVIKVELSLSCTTMPAEYVPHLFATVFLVVAWVLYLLFVTNKPPTRATR